MKGVNIPRVKRSRDRPEILHMEKSTAPTGGVMSPSTRLKHTTTPKCKGSTPIFSAMGDNMGVMITSAGAVSMGMPMSSNAMFTRTRNTYGLVEKGTRRSVILAGSCSTATIHAKGSERPRSMSTTDDSTPALRIIEGSCLNFSRL